MTTAYDKAVAAKLAQKFDSNGYPIDTPERAEARARYVRRVLADPTVRVLSRLIWLGPHGNVCMLGHVEQAELVAALAAASPKGPIGIFEHGRSKFLRALEIGENESEEEFDARHERELRRYY
jgi:hypothetical protein